MQAGVSLLDMNVMPMFMIIALDVIITMHISISCLAVICSPTVIFPILREATSETNGPRVSFLLYCISFIYIASCLLFCNLYFPIYTTKIPKIFILLLELCCDIFPWVPDLDRTHLRAWLVYDWIRGITIMYIGITSATSRSKQFCIYYYYSTHRPLSSMHLEY